MRNFARVLESGKKGLDWRSFAAQWQDCSEANACEGDTNPSLF